MIGSFGDVVFQVSDGNIMTFQNLQLSSEGRWASQEVISGKPRAQYLGPGTGKVSFEISVSAAFGVKPRDMIDRLTRKVENGEVNALIIGGRPISGNPFYIKSISATWGEVFNGGELYSAKMSLSLEEYV